MALLPSYDDEIANSLVEKIRISHANCCNHFGFACIAAAIIWENDFNEETFTGGMNATNRGSEN